MPRDNDAAVKRSPASTSPLSSNLQCVCLGVASRVQLDATQEAMSLALAPNASRLTTNDKVQARIDELVGEAAEKARVTIERIVGRDAKIGVRDVTRALTVTRGTVRLTRSQGEPCPEEYPVLLKKQQETTTRARGGGA